ncbi:MAG: hypothetical protein JXR83_03365 [Deltaproteobacteria bacterium]|nr:hypothetical protein [Deltaproteobacteria bacterium]
MGAGRRRRLDILLLGAALLGACSGSTDCGGCLGPLTATFPEASKINSVVQTRLTPRGVDFLEQNLPTILQSFISIPCGTSVPAAQRVPCPDGMTCVGGDHCVRSGQRIAQIGFKIPFIEQLDPAWCLGRLSLCENPGSTDCLAYIELLSTTITPTTPAHLNISVPNTTYTTWIPSILERSAWYCPMPAPDCKIRVTKKNRTMAIGADMATDNPLQRLELKIGDPDIPLTADDIELDNAGGVADWIGCKVADLLLPLFFPLFRDTLINQINSTVKDAASDQLVEGCDSSATPPERCNSSFSTTCDSDKRCHFASSGRYVPKLLGLEGEIDLAAMLGAFAGQAAPVAISAGAGGYSEVVRSGIEVGLRGGARTTPATCAPPLPADLPLPPRLRFTDTIQPPEGSTSRPYMVGIAIADRLLEETGRAVVSSGALCQRLDAGLSSFVNTGAIGLLASSLNCITRNSALPALIEILPRAPLSIDIGLGTSRIDPQDPDQTILDRPLLTFRAHDLDLDLYALLDDRYARFMTMRVDLAIGIGLEDDGNGNLLLLVSGPETWLTHIEVLNSELLTDDPDDIADAVPSLIGALISQLAPQLQQTFSIPDLAGFGLHNLTIRGVEPRLNNGTPVLDPAGNAVYEFLGLYSDLVFDPAQVPGQPLRTVVDTIASVRELQVPPASGFSVDSPGGLQEPKLLLDVALANRPDSDRAEFSYRVDGGFWRPFHRGAVLHVVDPILHLMARHRVEVRGRLVDAPATLDPEPAVIDVIIDPLPPEVTLAIDKDGPRALLQASDAITAADDLLVRHRFDLGAWSEQRGLAPIALPTMVGLEHRLDVEVIDEAGNAAAASLGGLPLVPAGPDQIAAEDDPGAAATAAEATGCGCSAAAPLPSALALLVALGLIRRRS